MLSYGRGPKLPLLEETIYTAFAKTVARHPQADALTVPFQNVRLSFAELLSVAAGSHTTRCRNTSAWWTSSR